MCFIRGLFSITSRRFAIVFRLAAVLPCLFSVGVAGQPVERRIDARIPGALTLLLFCPVLLAVRGSIRCSHVSVAATPFPVDARLRAVALGGRTVVSSSVGGRVAGFSCAVTSFSRAISAVGCIDHPGEAGLALVGSVFAVVGHPVTFVGHPVTFVGDLVPLIRVPVALIRVPVAIIRGSVPFAVGSLAHLPVTSPLRPLAERSGTSVARARLAVSPFRCFTQAHRGRRD